MNTPTSNQAPVVPNASKVRGSILRKLAGTEGQGSEWEVRIEHAESFDGLPDFAESYVGQVITLSIPGPSPECHEGDNVEARISYVGDEHGGRFVVRGNTLKKV